MRVGAVILAIVVSVGAWLPLEFVRAHVTDGLPTPVQFASMSVPVVIAGAFGYFIYFRIVRR
jgi:hypothetical protein